MLKDMLLMMKDIEVMRINFDLHIYEVINDKYLPFTLKNKIKTAPTYEEDNSKYGELLRFKAADDNKEEITVWLANRVLLLSRANAKWIYNALNIEQLNTDRNKARFAVMCRAVSLLDSYWLKLDGDGTCWDKVDIRKNPLNETIAQIALHGKSITIQGSLISPELTTNGAYAKAWRRYLDNNLWLHKLGAHGNEESRIEVMCSNILDKINVEHVKYIEAMDEDKYVCACPCITTEDLAILSGMDFISYCNVHGLNPDIEMLKIDSESIYKMWQVDYLISNRDRHGQNWGFYYDVNTMQILRCHPLFDHNNAFDKGYMDDPNAKYQFCGMSIRSAAKHGYNKCPIEFTQGIVRQDFITDRQYNSFMDRAKDLGMIKPTIPVTKKSLDSLFSRRK